MVSKKAAISFSVKFIVGLIIILVVLILLIYFMKTAWERSSLKLEEQIVAGAPKPYTEILSPDDYAVFEVGDEVFFESFVYTHTSNTKIAGYFWDFDGDLYIDSREENPNHIYYEPGDYKVILKVLNSIGGVGEDSIVVRIFTKNNKSMDKYDGDHVFFIPSEGSPDPELPIINWREILQLIPLTRWYDKLGDHEYEYVAIAKGEGLTIDSNDIKDKLDSMDKDSGVTFDIEGISIPEYDIRNEQTDDLVNYFSYWEKYNSVVLVADNNFEGALIAALFASYYNSPLMFIEDRGEGGVYSDYDAYLLGKKVYVIDNLPPPAFIYYITGGRINDWKYYSSDELRDPSRKVNRIIELKSKLLVKD